MATIIEGLTSWLSHIDVKHDHLVQKIDGPVTPMHNYSDGTLWRYHTDFKQPARDYTQLLIYGN